jgi:4-hydroxy-4-methyl-2-oxoglutarate aldolase
MLEGFDIAPGTIFDPGPRQPVEAMEVFRRVGVSNVASALGGPVAQQRLLDAHAIPRWSGSGVVVGSAVTVWHPPGSNGMLTAALDLIQPGDVLVVSGPTDVAQWGDIATTVATRKQVAGAVLDGAVRDLDRIREMGFSLWGSRVFAGQGYRKDAGFVNVPILVKGLLVHPDDVIVADSDGILSIPSALVGLAHARAAAREQLEQTIVTEARDGKSPSRRPNFEIAPDLLTQFTGSSKKAGLTWKAFVDQPPVKA